MLLHRRLDQRGYLLVATSQPIDGKMTIHGLRHECDEWLDGLYEKVMYRVERSEARFMHQHAMNLCVINSDCKWEFNDNYKSYSHN